jgi:hypothetical protein
MAAWTLAKLPLSITNDTAECVRCDNREPAARASWWARGDLNPHILSDTGT